MDPLLILLALPGFIIGNLFFSRIGHLIAIAVGLAPTGALDVQYNEARSRKDLVTTITYLCSWIVLFGGITTFFFFNQPAQWAWFWFFLGVTATPLLTVPILLQILKQRGESENIEQ